MKLSFRTQLVHATSTRLSPTALYFRQSHFLHSRFDPCWRLWWPQLQCSMWLLFGISTTHLKLSQFAMSNYTDSGRGLGYLQNSHGSRCKRLFSLVSITLLERPQ